MFVYYFYYFYIFLLLIEHFNFLFTYQFPYQSIKKMLKLAKKCAKPAMIKKTENIMGRLVCLQNAKSCHRKQKKSQPRPQPQNWILGCGCGCSHHFVNSLSPAP